MAPADMLNSIAGKSTQTPSRKRARTSTEADQSSPRKRQTTSAIRPDETSQPARRSSGILSRRSIVSASKPARRDDDQFEVPEDSPRAIRAKAKEARDAETTREQDKTANPKGKKMRMLKNKHLGHAASNTAVKGKVSPLKAHDFGTVDPTKNANVKLSTDDSPAKNLRGLKKGNPLFAMDIDRRTTATSKKSEQQLLPAFQADEIDDGNQDVGEDGAEGDNNKESSDDVYDEEDDGRSSSEEERGEGAGRPHEHNALARERTTTVENNEDDHDEEVDDAQGRERDDVEDAANASKQGNTQPDARSAVRPKKTNVTAPTHGIGPTSAKKRQRMLKKQQSQQHQRRKAQEKANRDETKKDQTEKFKNFGKNFVQGMTQDPDEINNERYSPWFQLGAGTLSLEALLETRSLKSDIGKRVQHSIKTLQALFQQLEPDPQTQNNAELKIKRVLEKLNNQTRNEVLEPPEGLEDGDESVVNDIYRFLIPSMVGLLKNAYMKRCSVIATDNSVVTQMIGIASITINLCNIAQDWVERPEKLEVGIMNHVRRDIRPHLKTLYNKWSMIKLDMERKVEKAERMRLLHLDQKRAREAFALAAKRRDEARKAQRQKQVMQQMPDRRTRSVVENEDERSWDIDEVEVPNTPSATDEGNDFNYRVRPERHNGTMKRGRRQATEESIPPPVPASEWTEEENRALLAGLEVYTGADRFARIYDELRDRELHRKGYDEIISQANYFEQVKSGG